MEEKVNKRPKEACGKKIVYRYSGGVIATIILSLVTIALYAGMLFMPYVGGFDAFGTGVTGLDFIKNIFAEPGVKIAGIEELKLNLANLFLENNTIMQVGMGVFIYIMGAMLLVYAIFVFILIIYFITLCAKGHLKGWKAPYWLTRTIFGFAFWTFYLPLIAGNIFNAWIKQPVTGAASTVPALNGMVSYIVLGLLFANTIALHVIYNKCFKHHVYVRDEKQLAQYVAEYEQTHVAVDTTPKQNMELPPKNEQPMVAPQPVSVIPPQPMYHQPMPQPAPQPMPQGQVVPPQPVIQPRPPVTPSVTPAPQARMQPRPAPVMPAPVAQKVESEDDKKKHLPAGLKEIGSHAFAQNVDLEDANIPEGIENIGPGAFANCVNLRRLHIPESVKKIEYNCFFNCMRLEKITYGGTKVQWRKIKRGSNWLISAGTRVVICRDGAITVDASK